MQCQNTTLLLSSTYSRHLLDALCTNTPFTRVLGIDCCLFDESNYMSDNWVKIAWALRLGGHTFA